MYLARARLAACEALQGMILSEGGHLSPGIDPERIARFQDHVRKHKETARPPKSKFQSAEKFGRVAQFAILGIQDALIHHEVDRTTAREAHQPLAALTTMDFARIPWIFPRTQSKSFGFDI